MDNHAYFSDSGVQQAIRFAQSPAGKQLLALLESQDKTALQNAFAKAAEGDLDPAKQLIASLQESPEGKKIMGQMGRK